MAKDEPKAKDNGADKQRAPLVVPRNACHLGEAKRNAWEIDLPAGAKPEELLDRSALGPVARELSLKDLIYAQPSDGSWVAIYRVVDAGLNHAQLALLQKFDLPARVEDDQGDPPGFRIQRDDVLGWHAIRLADGVMMGNQRDNPDLRSREMTRRYVQDHPSLRAPR